MTPAEQLATIRAKRQQAGSGASSSGLTPMQQLVAVRAKRPPPPAVTAPSFNATPGQAIGRSQGGGFLGSLGRGITDFGVGVGAEIGKAGLGLGEIAARGVGQFARITSGAEGKKTWDDIAGNIRGIKEAVYEQPQFQEANSSVAGTLGRLTGVGAEFLAPSSAVVGAQRKITGVVDAIPAITQKAKFARGALGVLGRAIPEAASGGAVGYAVSGGDTKEAVRDALLQGGGSLVLGSLGSAFRGIKGLDTTKKVLSSTSGIPKGAMDEVGKTGINPDATPEEALGKARGAVRTLRKNLSAMWDARVPQIDAENAGKMLALSKEQAAEVTRLADEFSVDPKLLPKDLTNMTAKEAINLMKGFNELDSLAVKSSPRGAAIRRLRPELRQMALNAFGGEEGSLGQLWRDYASKKGVHDAVDSIVRAYVNNKPITDVTAKNRLMAIFDENKDEYLNAIKALEDELGINITGDVASTKFSNWLPQGIVKADGGLPTRAGVLDKLARLLAFPITSPKMVGKAVTPAKSVGPATERLFGAQAPIQAAPTAQPIINATIKPSTTIPETVLPGAPRVNGKLPLQLKAPAEGAPRSQVGSGPSIQLPAKSVSTQDAEGVAARAGDRFNRNVRAGNTQPLGRLMAPGENPIPLPEASVAPKVKPAEGTVPTVAATGKIPVEIQKQADEYIKEGIFIKKGQPYEYATKPLSMFNGVDIKASQGTVDKGSLNYWKKKILSGERPAVLLEKTDYGYRIVDGHTRGTAYQQLGTKEVPVLIIRE